MTGPSPAGTQGPVGSVLSQLSKLSPRGKLLLAILVLAIIVAGVVAAASHPGPNPSGTSNLPWTPYQVHTVPSEVSASIPAYSIVTPHSWTWVVGKLIPGQQFPGLAFETKYAGGLTVFGILPVASYIDQDQYCGATPGGTCAGYTVYPLPSGAKDYITTPGLLKTALTLDGVLPSDLTQWSVDASNARPDLQKVFGVFALSGTGVFYGADGLISYSSGGTTYKLGVEVGVTQILASVYGLTPEVWSGLVLGVSAPENQFDSAASAFSSVIVPSVSVNPQWVTSELQAGAQASQMIFAWNQRIQQNQYNAFVDQSNSQAAVGRAWGDALGGVQEYVDPTDSSQYTLPYTAGDYYYHVGDTFYPTNTDSAPSDCQAAGNCVKLNAKTP
jgi:hypothetical protein